MYLQFFGLTEAPFSITPDPAFVYLSAAHRDALAHLLYGVGQGGAGGFVQLTGEVGTGKTTLCRCLLEQVPDDTRIALILNPLVTPHELLATICEELGVEIGDDDSSKDLVDALNSYLLDEHAQGRRVVVVIDEAQNLSPEALEQVRLLTNLETAKDKLLQMVLLGQPELRSLLRRQDLRQLAQRITARYHLAPLSEQETFAYVRHRMQVAGAQANPFGKPALRALFRRSDGIPRLINIIADRALSAAYAAEAQRVSAAMVNAAANEVQPSESGVKRSRWPFALAGTAVIVLVTALALQWTPTATTPEETIPASGSPGPGLAGESSTTNPPSDSSPALQVVAPPPDTGPAATMPGDDWLSGQHRSAWQVMSALWQDEASANAIQAACDGAQETGYACLRDQGNWTRLSQLGLPVVMVLAGETPLHLPLLGIGRDTVLVGSPQDSREVPRVELESRWLGDYLVPWPQANDWPEQIGRGEAGVAVDIVMEMAAYAEPAWTGTGVFDASFESWLMAFQRRHGLEADGIVGPNTLLYLMAPTILSPRLITDMDERS